MISVNDLRQGTVFHHEGAICQVLEFHRHKMARAKAVVNVKIKDVKTGKVREVTFRSSDLVEEVDAVTKTLDFVYFDGRKRQVVLSDPESKKRIMIDVNVVGEDQVKYLSAGISLVAMVKEEFPGEFEIFTITLPKTVDLEVVQAPPGGKGDTASGGTKVVEVSTGLKINTPFFIKKGDIIRVNTGSGDYIERVANT